MSSVTPRQRLPYPTPTRRTDGSIGYNDRGNGALDLQLLAEAADRQFDDLDAAWPAELQKPTKLIGRNSNITGLTNGVNHLVTFNQSLSAASGLNGLIVDLSRTDPKKDVSGWYHVLFQLSSVPAGAANVGSRRQLRADVFSSADGILESYFNEELEPGGGHICGNDLSFITFMDDTITINLWFFHTNTSSAVNITTITYATYTRICPAV